MLIKLVNLDTDNMPDTDTEPITETALSLPNSSFGELAPQTNNIDLRKQLQFETDRREILRDFIKHHLVEGIDYGRIHVVKTCDNKYNCRNEYHFAKQPMLFKPGQEKFMSLMHFVTEFKPDYETKEMLGSPEGLICYLCVLYDYKGRYISNGRGAAALSEGFDANKVIKMAQKRAKLDAIMQSGILADFFSIEKEPDQPKAQPSAIAKPADPNACPNCGSKTEYHSRSCPNFKPPAARAAEAGEVIDVDYSKLTNPEEVEDLEDLPF